MQPKIRISIVTPVYNASQFIGPCIVNVMSQACNYIEHLIIDGGSSDDTVEIIRSYATKFPHIRWVSEKDRGQSDAINKGIIMAQGGIVSVLNADDFYERGAIKFALTEFAHLPEPSLLVGNCNVWNDEKILWVNKPAQLDLRKLLTGNEKSYPFPVNPSAYFYHKSLHDIIGYYDTRLHYEMDLDFIIKALPNSYAKYVDITLGNFRYLAGTKTFEGAKSGAGAARLDKLIKENRDKLPWRDWVYVATLMQALKIRQRLNQCASRVVQGFFNTL